MTYLWNAWPNQYDVCGESSVFTFPAARELWEMAGQGKLTAAQKLLTLSNQPPEMLFNVKEDPFQFTNLATNANAAGTLQEMRRLLAEWKLQTGDSVPAHPTADRDTLHEAGRQPIKRGQFPGAVNHATEINQPGPIRLDVVP